MEASVSPLKPCFFSRLSRAEMGHRYRLSGPCLLRYTQEDAWREDRSDNGAQIRRVAQSALSRAPSIDFAGCYRQHIREV
jgi:hypothetical protein